MTTEYINTILAGLRHCGSDEFCDNCPAKDLCDSKTDKHICTRAADVIEELRNKTKINGETSDGYHTFNELYHHRAILFSVIVRTFRELAWKSKQHHDGTMYDGMFIVGIETPDGQATYHYDVDPYWDMFDCKEVEQAPEWDGHTPDEAIKRIETLRGKRGKWKPLDGYLDMAECSECGEIYIVSEKAMLEKWMEFCESYKYCPNCGARMEAENVHKTD